MNARLAAAAERPGMGSPAVQAARAQQAAPAPQHEA
jgi:hypothetical protein